LTRPFLGFVLNSKCKKTGCQIWQPVFLHLEFNTNPKNGRVKSLRKACLDRTYFM